MLLADFESYVKCQEKVDQLYNVSVFNLSFLVELFEL